MPSQTRARMEPWLCRGLSLARILQLLLLLGSMFYGTGIDEEPSVRLYYQYVNTVRFNCSSQVAFPGMSTSSFRMLQIEHFNETKPRGDIWAIIERDSGGQARAVSDTVLKMMGETSVSVSGSINTLNVSWLHLTLFGSEIDVNMRNCGTLTCSVRHTDGEGAWTSNDIIFAPGMRFPVKEDGFEAVNDSAVDLTCLAKIPPIGGSQDATLTITRTADNVALASWNPDKNLQCLDDVICSPVRHFRDVYFYARVRLMEAPERGTEYRCSVQINEKEYSSERIRILPDAQCACHGDQTWRLVVGLIVGFMIGLAAASAFFLTDNCGSKALFKRLT